MIKVNVLSEDKSWSKKIKKKEIFFNSICKSFPKKYQFTNKKIFLTLLLSNNRGIKKLNKKFRKKHKSTDVLSFPDQKKMKSFLLHHRLLLFQGFLLYLGFDKKQSIDKFDLHN